MLVFREFHGVCFYQFMMKNRMLLTITPIQGDSMQRKLATPLELVEGGL